MMSGVDQVLALKETMARSPMMRLLEVEVVSAQHGEVVLSATPDHRFDNQGDRAWRLYRQPARQCLRGRGAFGAGRRHYCLTLRSRLPIFAPSMDSGTLEIVGRVQKAGRQVVVTEGVIRDAQGRDLATATSTLIVQPIEGAAA
jgi:acyl-coenzyme A thioesterase PaaI-like protein